MDTMFTINIKFNEASDVLPVSIYKDQLFAYLSVMHNRLKLETIKFLIEELEKKANENDIIRIELNKVKDLL
jgi:hypothetical protein